MSDESMDPEAKKLMEAFQEKLRKENFEKSKGILEKFKLRSKWRKDRNKRKSASRKLRGI